MATKEYKMGFLGLVGIFSVAGVFTSAIFCCGNQAYAQIIPDETLGERSSTIAPNVNIKGSVGDVYDGLRLRIDGGAIRGANLFHSFREFNVGDSQRVYFANPTGIENILTRVTGNHISNILGTLGVDGAANLFLLNPNGIIFGPNARLDIAGSFMASTANSFVLGGGMEFSATNPQAPPLLKINLTPGLQYGNYNPLITIENRGNLAVGQDLSLFALNLDLQGQLQAGRDLSLQADTIKVRDRVTNPFVAAAGGKLLVQGKENIDIFALNHPGSGLFSRGDMVLRSANNVGGDAHFWSGGSFRIEKLDGSLGNLFSPHDPIIRSQGDVSFFAYQGASLHILAGGKVDINTVVITNPETAGESINPATTPSLANVTLSDGTAIIIDGSVKPTLDIRAGMNTAAIGNPLGSVGDSGIFLDDSISPVAPPENNSVATSADITIGDVRVNSPQGIVLLTNQYQPNPALTGGNITLTGKGALNIGGIVAGSVEGDGSSVIFDSRGKITLAGSFIDAFSGSTRAGDITLLANGDIKLDSGAAIFANALRRSTGDVANALGGDIRLISGGNVSIDGANIYVIGNGGGNIIIDAQNINILGSSFLSGIIGNFGTLENQAGDIQLKAHENISIVGSDITNSVIKGAVGNAGKILVQANGSVSLSGTNSIFNSVGLGLNAEGGGFAVGKVGGIAVKADSLSLSGGYELVTSTQGQGDAGNMQIDVRNLTSFDGVDEEGFPSGLFATVFQSGIGNGGNINLRTRSLSITDGARIQTKSEGQGNTGDVTILASDRIFFDGTEKNPNPAIQHLTGIFTTVQTTTPQQGGNINLKTGDLTIINGAQLTSNTFGLGNSGNVMIEASGKVSFDGINNRGINSGIFSAVGRDDRGNIGQGSGGDIQIVANSLSLTNGAALASATEGVGDAGKIKIVAPEAVFLDGMGNNEFVTQIVSAVEPEAIGNANDIEITTGLLTLTNGAQLRASTDGQGKAGNIIVTANTYKASNGGQLRTTTSSNFDAGNITLKVRDNISLSGSETGLFANTTDGSIGNGGNIFIDPRTINITDGAKIAVDSQGTGDGGSIELAAGFLTLDNATISADTRSNIGGDINLNLQDLLLLRNGSRISTNAGNSEFGGDGGNIVINSPFIAAVPQENSNITANAFTGKGGRVDINSNGIFGIVPQERLTPLSDITASSEFGIQGFVTINTPDVDPSRGLVQLPSNLVDASQKIVQSCNSRGKIAGRFISTGRGGLPPSPLEPLRGSAIMTNWVTLPAATTDKITQQTPAPEPIVEAQGWIVNPQGEIILVGQSPQMNYSHSLCN